MDDLDLMVVRRLNKVKVVSCILIILAILILIIVAINNSSKEKKQESLSQEKNVIEVQLENDTNEGKMVEIKNVKLPVLTEEAKEKIDNIYHLEGKTAYLTFDDGPSNSVTPLILQVLKEKNVKATFFTLGSRVELYPELVRQEYDEGHYIANHGYTHVYSSIYQTPEEVLSEYNQTEQAIKNALGNDKYNSHLFRFPGGSVGGKYAEIKSEAIEILAQNNIAYLDWNALTNDAAGANTKEEMMEYLVSTVGEKSNVVILMHDAADKILTYELLPEIIDYLAEKGYTFENFYNIIK